MKLDLFPLSLSGVILIRSARVSDSRGIFAETYVKGEFANSGISSDFVQDNQSFSVTAGTVRGLHFQIPPFQQAKLVRVLRGKIFDVVVDLRRSSTTYGKHISVELSADGGEQLFVPSGLAHGFCTLVEDTEVFYKLTPSILLPMTAGFIGSIRRWASNGQLRRVRQFCRIRTGRCQP
jgi:dTDP-4-dehydrorhamnose 3,5-epimerase